MNGTLLAAAAAFALAGIQVQNGGFESETNGRPSGWRTQTWGGSAQFSLDRTTAKTGKNSILVRSDNGADAGFTTTVQVKPNSKYRITAWIKTEGVVKTDGQGATLNLHSRPEHAQVVSGTKDWTQVSMDVDTGDDDSLQLNCILGYYGSAKGKAWFDDVEVTFVSSGPEPPDPSVEINGTSTRAPLSKYIYSQFIEHLGRCIYGGIWAEILEDRKFFEPVGDRRSPWKAVEGGSVRMDAKNPFVGDHTPVVKGGISQGGLTVVKGSSYVGRVWLKGSGSAKVSLVWGPGAGDRQTVSIANLSSNYTKFPLKFTAGADAKDAQFVVTGTGEFSVGTASLMPSNNVMGMRPDTLKLLKELNAPLYRWPGGNFVSGYDWRDGIGDPDRRPPRKNPAWTGIEHNDFGIHEFLAFCQEINTEPEIVVNTGFGDSHSAMEEVKYVNGPATDAMGKWRAENGRKEPWKVKWWAIGNEMFGSWQLGYMSIDHYVLKHNDFAKKMKAADPSIKLIGVGAAGSWSERMLRACSDNMNLLSEHFYSQERTSLRAHVLQIPNAIRDISNAHRQYRKTIPGLAAKDIRVSMDEWNYWYGPHVFGELGTRYFMKDALGIAAGIHEYSRQSDIVYMANYAQTVNVIGAIKTTPTQAWMETTGLVLQLYRSEFGSLPINVTGPQGQLDIAAAWSSDRKEFTLAVVNPTVEAKSFALNMKNLPLASAGKKWTIENRDPQAFNDGSDYRVKIVESLAGPLGTTVSVDPVSVTLYKYRVK